MMRKTTVAAFTALALAMPGAAFATGDQDARRELEQARKELQRAKEELQKATREVVRAMAVLEKDNPKAQYYRYITNPQRAVLGIIIDDEKSKPSDRGVRVLAVSPGGGAEQAGLEAGDLILALDSHELAKNGGNPHRALRERMRELEAGDVVTIQYERSGKRAKAEVKTQAPDPDLALAPLLGQLDVLEDLPNLAHVPPPFGFRGRALQGLELCAVNEDLAYYFKTDEGVLVLQAPKEVELGLKSGDVILRIDGVPVAEPVTVMDRLRSRSKERDVTIEIIRRGKRIELTGKIPVALAPAADHRIVIERRYRDAPQPPQPPQPPQEP